MHSRVVILIAFLTGSVTMCVAQGVTRTKFILPGQKVKLTAVDAAATRYQWYRDGLPVSNAGLRELITAQPGTYTVQAFNQQDCPSDLSDPVIIREMTTGGPSTDVQISKESDRKAALVNYNLSYLLTVTNNGPLPASSVVVTDILPPQLSLESIGTPSAGRASYDAASHKITWEIGDLAVRQPATLSVSTKVLAAGRIENTALVTAAENDSVPGNNKAVHVQQVLPLHIPNTITPNGDGANDKFIVRGLEKYPENEITIINRWGNHVFEQKNYQQNWDGKGLNDGTYFYLIRVKDENGRWQDFKGYIMILR